MRTLKNTDEAGSELEVSPNTSAQQPGAADGGFQQFGGCARRAYH